MTDDTKCKPLTRAQSKLVDASVAIFGEQATKKDAAFIARELVQASLPHKNPGDVLVWTRMNGNLTLIVQQGRDRTGKPYGYPYGTIPRLLLFWITTEAKRTGSRRLELGGNLSGFMVDIGLNPDTGGGKRSDAKRLRDQMERLFRCRISFEAIIEQGGRKGEAGRDMLITEDRMLWWNEKNPEQGALWGSVALIFEPTIHSGYFSGRATTNCGQKN